MLGSIYRWRSDPHEYGLEAKRASESTGKGRTAEGTASFSWSCSWTSGLIPGGCRGKIHCSAERLTYAFRRRKCRKRLCTGVQSLGRLSWTSTDLIWRCHERQSKPFDLFSPKKIPVTILGATGVVGQRFLRRIADHPWFYPAFLAASDRSAGKKYSEACQWHLSGLPYAGYGDMTVAPCTPEAAFSPIVFSALDTGPARDIEPLFAAAGAYVFSNASAFRMDEDVPLLIPELNPDHCALLSVQQAKRGWRGAIVTNPNCTTVMLAAPLAALHTRFGLDAVMVTSMQAISGAGYPGVPALDIVGNVIPYIRNEESKVESESNKILGTLVRNGSAASVVPAPFVVSATCTRVPVIDGHTLTVSVRLTTKASLEDLVDAFRTFEPKTAAYDLPSARRGFLHCSTPRIAHSRARTWKRTVVCASL